MRGMSDDGKRAAEISPIVLHNEADPENRQLFHDRI